ncbi:GNAT family N-acetyltransferase [Isoptericola variabilis]|uniref:GCN5-related N-acetyltransferase n=1 Tax=Isoptericola variabilis (strain 225) TaxID=743718 RepID=F6FVF9_ISOV2|nr:GNAT family N-acetyltransferase [Isoptericola variabilis]AEG44386.1 GCN5-related N-acetyltransferase [Isoptericola variabilis 225]TWH34379.1 putative acetyltransferase [Isoptericola variabilis J7]
MSLQLEAGRIALAGVDLPARWATHPVVVAENVRRGWDATHVWFDDDALLARLRWRARTDGEAPDVPFAVEHDDAGVSLLAVGEPDAAARLVLDADAQLRADGRALGPVTRTSVPRGTHRALAALAAARGVDAPAPFDRPPSGAWDWLGTTAEPPAQPGEDRVVELAGEDGRAEVAECLAVAHPHGELPVDEPRSRWFGWRDHDGVLRGVVGASRRVPGQPWVLGSVGTDPAWRGRGIAAAVTAVATREGLAEAPMVTLGMYADNDTARRLYRRLGYEVAQEFESWRP